MIARRISLFTGLYLFAFVFAHLVNLSLGLKSIDVMDEARGWLIAPWSNPIGGGLLLGCLFFHMLLGLRALYLRNTLRLSAFDAFQLLLGLSIPILLFPHMITMALVPMLTSQHATYEQVLAHFWINNPWLGLRQIIGLMVVWLHGCMGLFVWLRLQSWWNGVSLFVYPTVVLLPTLAMLGFVEAGKEVIASVEPAPSAYQSSLSSHSAGDSGRAYASAYASDYGGGSGSASGSASDYGRNSNSEERVADKRGYDRKGGSTGYAGSSESSSGNDDGSVNSDGDSYFAADSDSAAGSDGDDPMQIIAGVVRTSTYGYLILLALVLAARAWRLYPAGQQVRIRFGTNEVMASGGASLLEISRLHDISHASLCGGKGRCGTCQVAIMAGQENLTAPTEVEKHKLRQIDAADHIRLACQARVNGGVISLEPVLPGFVVADDMPHRRSAPIAAQASGAAIATNTDLIDDEVTESGDQP